MSIRDNIKLEALDLEVGQASPHLVCPKCEGGSNAERSLSITRTEEGLLYKCHRNSCSLKGFIGSRPQATTGSKERRAKPFTHPTRLLGKRERRFLNRRFGLSGQDVADCLFCDARNRLVFPFYTPEGYPLGCVARGYDELGEYDGPKAITYFDSTDRPLADFHLKPDRPNPTVVVEDVVSARKISKAGYSSVALLGTELSDDIVVQLINYGVTDVIVWLDADANKKATELVTRYYLTFKNIRSIQTRAGSPDPKDRDIEDITTIIGEYERI